MKGNYTAHQNLIKNFLIELPKYRPDVFAMEFTTGTFRAMSDPDKIIKVGMIGAFDLILLSKKGFLWLDAKTGNAVLSPEQKRFANRMREVVGRDCAFPFGSIDTGLFLVGKYL